MSKAKFKHDKIEQIVLEGMKDGLAAIQISASRLMRATLSRPGTGRVYRIGKGKKKGRNLRARGFHQASSPGMPPAVNTNRLRASWSVEGVPMRSDEGFAYIYQDGTTVTLMFGSNVDYAVFLEYGTRKMAARPYVAPTMSKIEEKAMSIMAKSISDAFKEEE